MSLVLHAVALLSLQINRIFPTRDVMHLIRPRVARPHIQTVYGDPEGYDAAIVPTNLPSTTVAVLVSSRMHFFLLDSATFRYCVWEGYVTFDEKKEIVADMMSWVTQVNQTRYQTSRAPPSIPNHTFYDYEDGLVFTEVCTLLKASEY